MEKRSLVQRVLVLGLFLVVAAGAAFAGGTPEVEKSEPAASAAVMETTDTVYDPASVGMDGEFLNSAIGDVMETYMADKTVPGAVVLVARDGKIVYYEAFGQMREGVPTEKDTIYNLCSMGKPLVAAAALTLVDQGKILLTDPLSMYIPEFANQKVAVETEDGNVELVPVEREVTLHDLLTMTSGIANANPNGDAVQSFVGSLGVEAGIQVTMKDVPIVVADNAKLIIQMPLLFQPGTKFDYTDATIDVLSYVIEVVSGMPLDTYMEEAIFEPCGMVDTGFYFSNEKEKRIAYMAYAKGSPITTEENIGRFWKEDEAPFGDLTLQGVFGENRSYFAGGLGIFSTVYDFFRFAQMMLNGGTIDGKRVLSQQLVNIMTTNQIGDQPLWNFGTDNRWGYMVEIQEDNVIDLPFDYQLGGEGAFGWMGAMGTRWHANPNEDTVVIFNSNAFWLWSVLPVSERIGHIVNRSIE